MTDKQAPDSEELHIAFLSVPNREVGLKLANQLVSHKLAACVTIIPGATSIYSWEGRIENSSEEILIAKIPASKVNGAIELVEGLHPYDVPEFVSVKASRVSEKYLNWAIS